MIYIHFPFCKSFCTYCDFYSVRERTKISEYTESLLREISLRKAFLRQCSAPSTLYIGGGTPSLWPVEQLEKVVEMLKEASVFGGQGGVMPDEVVPGESMPAGGFTYDEFTVEVNPDDVSPDYAAALRRLGVNRISMGVQSFSDRSLRWMNRRHSAAGAFEAYGILRSAGFDNISMDLIFGYDPVPWGSEPSSEDELMRMWRDDLEAMLRLRPEHISAYQMGVEEGSVLGEMAAAGRYREPSDELCASQYALLQRMLAEAGYEQYEVSNFALPGRRAMHNSGYWHRLPYIGLGPGAHSFDGDRRRSWNVSDVDRYISALGHTPAVGTDSGLGSCPVHGAGPAPGPDSAFGSDSVHSLDSALDAGSALGADPALSTGSFQVHDSALRPGSAPTATHSPSSFRSFTSDKISGHDATSSIVSEEILTDEDVFTETIMLGLRTVDGLPLESVFQGSCFGSYSASCPGSCSGSSLGSGIGCGSGCDVDCGTGSGSGSGFGSRTGSIAGSVSGSDARARSGIRSTGDVRSTEDVRSTLDAIDRFLADGSLILRDGRLCIPPDRLFISDSIIRGLL